MASGTIDRERERVREIRDDLSGWRRWGPYVSDRSWGTVREDYSARRQRVALSDLRQGAREGVPLGRGRHRRAVRPLPAPVLRAGVLERARSAPEGAAVRRQPVRGQSRRGREGILLPRRQHADALVHVPALQVSAGGVPVPRARSSENQRRAGQGPEYELLDTGVFDERSLLRHLHRVREGRSGGHLAIRITAHNRGPDAAPLHILPTLWFRNTWAWGPTPQPEPTITCGRADGVCLVTDDSGTSVDPNMPAHYRLGPRCLYGPAGAGPVHRQRDPRRARLRTRQHQPQAAHQGRVPPRDLRARPDGGPARRLRHQGGAALPATMVPARRHGHAAPAVHRQGDPRIALATVDTIIAARKAEADDVLRSVWPRESATADEKLVQRRALAGLLWTKQSYIFDVARWLDGDDPGAAAAAVAAHDPQRATGAT